MDAVIYVCPEYIFNDRDKTDWDCQRKELGRDRDGNWQWVHYALKYILTKKLSAIECAGKFELDFVETVDIFLSAEI